jgi:uncharacterized Zn-finger protein
MVEQAVMRTARAPGKATPNDRNCYEVTDADLPLHCPLPEMRLWDSHPRVYLPIEGTGEAKCPYCGADFILVERRTSV